MKLFVAKKRRGGGGFGSVGCVCAQETVLSAPGMRLLAASDTPFLTTMLRMNCIHVDVHGHVVSTFAVQEAAEDYFCSVLLQSDSTHHRRCIRVAKRISDFFVYTYTLTGNDIWIQWCKLTGSASVRTEDSAEGLISIRSWLQTEESC